MLHVFVGEKVNAFACLTFCNYFCGIMAQSTRRSDDVLLNRLVKAIFSVVRVLQCESIYMRSFGVTFYFSRLFVFRWSCSLCDDIYDTFFVDKQNFLT